MVIHGPSAADADDHKTKSIVFLSLQIIRLAKGGYKCPFRAKYPFTTHFPTFTDFRDPFSEHLVSGHGLFSGGFSAEKI